MTEPLEERSLWLRLLTPERIRFEKNVRWVQVPTADGLLGIWPLHAPLISAVVPGEVVYESDQGPGKEWIDGGILHVRHNQVLILTGSREHARVSNQSGVEAWDQSREEIGEILTENPTEKEQGS
jgi:F-type H+-transporting ATPase subunit epsilon